MAENPNPTAAVNEPEQETEEPEKTYTQAQLTAIVERKVKKATAGMFTADDMAAKDEEIKNLTSERDNEKSERAKAEEKLSAYQREAVLAKYGVTGDDAEYYAFKIGKLNAEENAKAKKDADKKTFEQTAEEFFKNNPVKQVRVDLGGNLGGKPAKQTTTNDQMNALIRNARK